jgi:hypothetical protein
MAGNARFVRRLLLGTITFVAACAPAATFGQGTSERKVDPLLLPLDKDDVWTLHFRYKPPRIVTVDAIDKDGKHVKKTVWYLWYQVYNAPIEKRLPDGKTVLREAEPVTCLPEFELVTKDLNTTHLDEPQPYIFDQIKRLEDTTITKEKPNGYYDFQTSIGISKRPIPPSRPDALPRVVSGLAIWTDMAERAPKTNKFAIYITGLSNGLAVEEPVKGGEKLIKRKTLQINFLRPTDDKRPQLTDIVPDDLNGPAEKWIYRTVSSIKPKKP